MKTPARIAALAILLALPACAALAQAAERMKTVGGLVFSRISPEALARNEHPLQRALVESLRERGWVEGRNIRYVWRSANGDETRLAALVAELLREKPDVLVAPGGAAVPALEQTATVPIVSPGFPPELIPTPTRPDRNLTGVQREEGSAASIAYRTKLTGLLKEITGARRVARFFLAGPGDGPATPIHPDTVAAAERIGVKVEAVAVRPGDDFERVLGEAKRRGVEGIIVVNTPLWTPENSARFVAAVRKLRLPVVGEPIFNAEIAPVLLATYGLDLRAMFERTGYFVDRLLRGAKVRDLPVEQVDGFRMVVYPRSAEAMGITIPPTVMLQAHEVR